jgi:Meiotically up-regulated gene 113
MTTEKVYAIGTSGATTVKIGRAVNPQQRLRQLQPGHPARLAVLWTTDGGSFLESLLHAEFRQYHVFGEWFDFGALDPIPLIDAAAARLQPRREVPALDRVEVVSRLRKLRRTRTERGVLPHDLIEAALDQNMGIKEIATEAGCSTTAVKSIRRASLRGR